MLSTLLFAMIINAITPKSAECIQNAAKVCMGSARVVFRSVRAHSFHANGLKHQTLPLMGATRLASGSRQWLTDRRVLSAVCEPAVSV